MCLTIACPEINSSTTKKSSTLPQNLNYNAQRILLVEDNEINQQVAMELLTTIGLNVKIANNGQEGVAFALAETFDLILMDIQMPVMDGLTATKLIRQQETLKNIPIVAMTAHAMHGDKEKSLAAGMNDHLTKPIALEKLVTMLNHWLNAKVEIPPLKDLTDDSFVFSLPPFDLKQALVFSNHNFALLHSLLLNFGKRYANATMQFQMYIDEQKFNEAAQLAHSIKGVAGTLAANELKNAATLLEIEFRLGEFEKIDSLLDDFNTQLNIAITAVNTLPPCLNEKQDEVSLTTEEIEHLFERFYTALKTNNFKASEIFTLLKSYLMAQNLQQEVEQLTHLLEQLDFQKALLILERVSFLIKGK